jgi:hypothetical protein
MLSMHASFSLLSGHLRQFAGQGKATGEGRTARRIGMDDAGST